MRVQDDQRSPNLEESQAKTALEIQKIEKVRRPWCPTSRPCAQQAVRAEGSAVDGGPVGIPNRQYYLFNTLRPPDHKGSEWGGGLNTLRAIRRPMFGGKRRRRARSL